MIACPLAQGRVAHAGHSRPGMKLTSNRNGFGACLPAACRLGSFVCRQCVQLPLVSFPRRDEVFRNPVPAERTCVTGALPSLPPMAPINASFSPANTGWLSFRTGKLVPAQVRKCCMQHHWTRRGAKGTNADRRGNCSDLRRLPRRSDSFGQGTILPTDELEIGCSQSGALSPWVKP